MPDEEKFHRTLQLANIFQIIDLKINILHPTIPRSFLEVDNLAQRAKTVFVFEGKSQDEQGALSQLKIRLSSLMLFKNFYISSGTLNPYDNMRLFYYTFKKQALVEFDFRGKKILSTKFSNLNDLANLLRNI